MCKNLLILQQIGSKYHPTLKKLVFTEEDDVSIYNTSKIVQTCMALVGGYEDTDGAYADFSDGSDAKTVSIKQRKGPPPYRGDGNIHRVKHKTGDLRIVAYNQLFERLDYFYIPQKIVRRLEKKNRIR